MLTRDEIAAMQPGHDLDAAIAEHVFLWGRPVGPSVPGEPGDWDQIGGDGPLRHRGTGERITLTQWCRAFSWREPGREGYYIRPKAWSTEIAAAWTIIDHVLSRRWLDDPDRDGMTDVRLHYDPYEHLWTCLFSWSSGYTVMGVGETVMEAICRAALMVTLKEAS